MGEFKIVRQYLVTTFDNHTDLAYVMSMNVKKISKRLHKIQKICYNIKRNFQKKWAKPTYRGLKALKIQ